MRNEDLPIIHKHSLGSQILEQVELRRISEELWPIVYILSNESIKEAYVGETTDLVSRMAAHLSSAEKRRLRDAFFISSDKFNKSATLDIESNLIKYLSGDGRFKLLNANVGLANHNYYQKMWYWQLFRNLWDKLRAEGVVRHSIDHIDNSDLFKYSPYKSLTKEQKKTIILMLRSILDPKLKTVILEGGAGTGKTVLAIFLFKLLNTPLEELSFAGFGEDEEVIKDLVIKIKTKIPDPKMALVIPMSSFRKTIEKIFSNVKGLKKNMVMGPSSIVESKYDIIVVDEAHRLRRRVTLGTYFKAFDNATQKLGLNKNLHTELDWVRRQGRKTILFYDNNQSIKPSDVLQEDFDNLKNNPTTLTQKLSSQMRVRGGSSYIDFIHGLLECNLLRKTGTFQQNKYEFLLFDSIHEMVEKIKENDQKHGLSRMVAGYSWPWISKNDTSKWDIHVEDISLKWNSENIDWINSRNAINEVGCIHTSQGYDLNYAGVIFGNEISYNEETDEIVIKKENYHDRNGKTGLDSPEQLKDYIINIYKTLMFRGIKGTYVYVCDEKLRAYFSKYIERFSKVSKSEKTPVVPIQSTPTFTIPLFDLEVAAGNFNEVQNVSNYVDIPLPTRYKSPQDLFACKVVGESMNKVIPNGSICLFRRYTGGSRNGLIVLVELLNMVDPDSGSSYTVKEYHSIKTNSDEGWRHESITLVPLSNDSKFQPIELDAENGEVFKVIGVFDSVLESP